MGRAVQRRGGAPRGGRPSGGRRRRRRGRPAPPDAPSRSCAAEVAALRAEVAELRATSRSSARCSTDDLDDGMRRSAVPAAVTCVGRRATGGAVGRCRTAVSQTKHIFVTGGVSSSLGKGLTASSLGRLLKARGVRVTMQKLDPYINVDPGTMNPFEHGEVFVTDDGAETDLDLGHYERFIDEPLKRRLQRHDRLDLPQRHRRRAPRRLPRPDRAGDPPHHRRDQVPHQAAGHRRRRRRDHRGRRHGRRHRDPPVPRGHPPDAQGRRPRQRAATSTSRSCPFLGPSGEQKTKPTQHSVTELRSRGIQPDVIVCRSDRPDLRRRSSARSPTSATCPPRRSSVARRRARRSTRSRWCCTRRASTTTCAGCSASRPSDGFAAEPDLTEWEALVRRSEAGDDAGARSASSASTSTSPTPTCRWSRRCATAASPSAPRSRSTGSRPRRSRACSTAGRLGHLDGIVIPGGFGPRAIEGKIAAASFAREHEHPVPRLCASACR